MDALRSMARREILQTKQLPPLSHTASRLLEMVGDPDLEVEDLAAVIEQDPALSARIIGMANAAYFGQRHPVVAVQEAIIRVLGMNMVKSLALSMSLCGSLDISKCPAFDLERFWIKALGTGTLARMLAQRMPPHERPHPDAVYMGGLLHNLGELVLVHLFPSSMNDMLLAWRKDPEQDPALLQTGYIGVNSAEAGAWLGARWKLPDSVLGIIAGLEVELAPADEAVRKLVALVATAVPELMEADASEASQSSLPVEGLDDAMIQTVGGDFVERLDDFRSLARMMM